MVSQYGLYITKCVSKLKSAILSKAVILPAEALWRDQPNRNDGHGALLRLEGGAAEKQIVIRFDDERLQRFLAGRLLTSARLRLTSFGRGGNWQLEVSLGARQRPERWEMPSL